MTHTDGLYLEKVISSDDLWLSGWLGRKSVGLENLDCPSLWRDQGNEEEDDVEDCVEKQELLLPKEYML